MNGPGNAARGPSRSASFHCLGSSTQLRQAATSQGLDTRVLTLDAQATMSSLPRACYFLWQLLIPSW